MRLVILLKFRSPTNTLESPILKEVVTTMATAPTRAESTLACAGCLINTDQANPRFVQKKITKKIKSFSLETYSSLEAFELL